MEKLELKHIAPYLPYGLKCITRLLKGNGVNWGALLVYGLTSEHALFYPEHDEECAELFDDIKPILRPLPDLTKEIEVNGEKFVPSEKIAVHLFDYDFLEMVIDRKNTNGIPYWVIELLLSWHFDIFNLIEKGLAIDINTLKS